MFHCPSCGREYHWERLVGNKKTNAPVGLERTMRCSNFLPDGSRCGVVFDIVKHREVVHRSKRAPQTFDAVPINRHWYSFYMPKQKYVKSAPQLVDLGVTVTEYFDVHRRDE